MSLEIRKIGRSFTWGVIDVIAIIMVFMIISQFAFNYFSYGTDPTDKDGFNRSGLNYYKDHGTGIEYIGNGNCIIRRESPTILTSKE